eukprot:30612-Pelagococcus_subviridis.AAC.25
MREFWTRTTLWRYTATHHDAYRPVSHVHAVDRPVHIRRQRSDIFPEILERLVELFEARVPDERRRDERAVAAPPERELRERHPGLFRDLRVLARRRLRGAGSIPELLRELRVSRVVDCGGDVEVFPGQNAPSEGVIRHEPDVLVRRRRRLGHSVLFRPSVDDAKVALKHARRILPDRARRVHARGEPVRVIVAHPPPAKLPLVDELPRRLRDLLEARVVPIPRRRLRLLMILQRLPPVALRRVPRRPVQRVHVHVVRPEAPQRPLEVFLDVLLRDVAAAGDLRRDDELLSARPVLLHPAPYDPLRVALRPRAVRRDRVLLRGVEEVHAALQHRAVHERVTQLLVRGVEVRASPSLRPERELADEDVRVPQALPSHAVDDLRDLVRRTDVRRALGEPARVRARRRALRGVRRLITAEREERAESGGDDGRRDDGPSRRSRRRRASLVRRARGRRALERAVHARWRRERVHHGVVRSREC